MHESRHIFFHMHAVDADTVRRIGRQVDVSVVADGLIVLGNLVALHQVGVHVLLAVELGYVGDLAVESESDPDGIFDGALVDYRQRARQCHRDGIDDGVWVFPLIGRARVREHLRFGVQLHVRLQTYDGFEIRSGGCGHVCFLNGLDVRYFALCAVKGCLGPVRAKPLVR